MIYPKHSILIIVLGIWIGIKTIFFIYVFVENLCKAKQYIPLLAKLFYKSKSPFVRNVKFLAGIYNRGLVFIEDSFYQ